MGAESTATPPSPRSAQQPSGEWLVSTDQGDILCEHVVSATGSFARQTGAMVGLDVPVIPVEHQYIVTEQHPAIMERRRQGLPEMGVLREADASWYMREEAGGLLLGPYEIGAPICYVDGPRRNPNMSCSPRISTGWSPISRRRSRACPPSARSASSGSITARSPTRPTAARSSARPGPQEFLAQRGPSASASPRRAAPAGSSRTGSSRASRRST